MAPRDRRHPTDRIPSPGGGPPANDMQNQGQGRRLASYPPGMADDLARARTAELHRQGARYTRSTVAAVAPIWTRSRTGAHPGGWSRSSCCSGSSGA